MLIYNGILEHLFLLSLLPIYSIACHSDHAILLVTPVNAIMDRVLFQSQSCIVIGGRFSAAFGKSTCACHLGAQVGSSESSHRLLPLSAPRPIDLLVCLALGSP